MIPPDPLPDSFTATIMPADIEDAGRYSSPSTCLVALLFKRNGFLSPKAGGSDVWVEDAQGHIIAFYVPNRPIGLEAMYDRGNLGRPRADLVGTAITFTRETREEKK